MTQRRDFFTQKQLLSDWTPPQDWFSHKSLAKIFHQRASQLPPGSVIAIQGGWGMGKTDLLARIFIEEKNRRLSEFVGDEKKAEKYFPIWINPWRQSVPDVISPIASILVNRLGLEKDARKKVLNTIISAGAAFVQKAGGAALVASGNPIVGGALMGLPSIFSTYRRSDSDTLEWQDPITELADAFSALVEQIISQEQLGRARLIRKVTNDLFLFASSEPKLKLRDETHVLTFFAWLTICNQFPDDRKKVLSGTSPSEAFTHFIHRIIEFEQNESGDDIHDEKFCHDARTLDPHLQLAGI